MARSVPRLRSRACIGTTTRRPSSRL
jgi:hypothetical protein